MLLPLGDTPKYKIPRRLTLPQGHPCSTMSAGGLNYCVRYGNRCCPSAIVTGNFYAVFSALSKLDIENVVVVV